MRKWKSIIKILLMVILVFTAGYMVFGLTDNNDISRAALSKSPSTKKEAGIPVVIETIKTETFTHAIAVQGNIEAQKRAIITTKIPGTIESVFADEGDTVTGKETTLFQIDALKLQKAVEMATQALEVAKCALSEKQNRLEQVEMNLEKTAKDYHRYKKLLHQGAVSRDGFEQIELRYKQAKVALKHANTLIRLAEKQEHQAGTALEIAEKDLKDSQVLAPLSGRVAKRFKEAGEMANPGEPVFLIEDPSAVEAVFFLPAQYYGEIYAGKTQIRLKVYNEAFENGLISYKSPTIHEKLRTFEIKCRISDPPEQFVPGAMVEAEVVLEEKTGMGISSQAVRRRKGSLAIFIVNDNTAGLVPIATGIERDGRIEIFAKSLSAGDKVVVEGQFLLNDQSPVLVQQEIN